MTVVSALEQKKAIVVELNEAATSAMSAVLVDYRGVAVADMTRLRSRSREAGVQVRVMRNTLARLAFQGTALECLSEHLSGPTLIGFSFDDPSVVARIFRDFAEDNKFFEVKALSIGGRVLPPEQISRLANLPTRDEALARLMMTMKTPVNRLALTLKDIPGRITRVLSAIREKKQEAD